MSASETALELPIGTYEEGLEWIGFEVRGAAPFPVNIGMIQTFAAAVQDGNPRYWPDDDEPAQSPPGQLHGWLIPVSWSPAGESNPPTVGTLVPLPGSTLVNVSCDTTFHTVLVDGDRLTYTEAVAAISGLKRTKVGDGYFVTTVTKYHRGQELVAEEVNTLFRYEPTASGEAA